MKKSFKFILKEILLGGHILSLGGVAVSLMFMLVLGLDVSFPVAFSIYFFGQPIFFIDRYKDLSIDVVGNKHRTKHISTYAKFIPAIVIAYISIFVVIMLVNQLITGLIFGLFLFIFGSLYGYLFKPITKYILAFKNIFVAVFWSIFGVYTVIQYPNVEISTVFLAFFLYVFLRSFLMQVFFDLKDLESDKKINLKTITLIWGRANTYKLLLFLSFISLLMIVVIFLVEGNVLLEFLSLLIPLGMFSSLIIVSWKRFKYIHLLLFQLEYIFSLLFMGFFLWIF